MADQTINDLEDAKTALGEFLPVLRFISGLFAPGLSTAIDEAAAIAPDAISSIEAIYAKLHTHSQTLAATTQAAGNPMPATS